MLDSRFTNDEIVNGVRGTIISFVLTVTGEATTKREKQAEEMKNYMTTGRTKMKDKEEQQMNANKSTTT